MISEVRYPDGGVGENAVREIRRIKARMEGERMPRGVEPALQVKLGPGGLSDVEWTVQLLQLRHTFAVPGLRTTRTLPAADRRAGGGPDLPRRRRSSWPSPGSSPRGSGTR